MSGDVCACLCNGLFLFIIGGYILNVTSYNNEQLLLEYTQNDTIAVA